MVSGRKACYMSKVCKFCLEKKYKTCIAVCLNIICLICINIYYPWNYAEFDNNAYFNDFHSAHNEITAIVYTHG